MSLRAVAVLVVCSSVSFASAAGAEIVVFKNGRTMSVRSHKIVDDMATLSLRSGGEVTFPASIIARVDPDELPFDSTDTREDAPFDSPDTREDARVGLAQGGPLVSDAELAARPFASLISTVAAAHEIDARLVHAVIEQESNYQPRARSRKGARGLMQLMPATARQYGVRNFYDPKANLDAGVRHLKDLLSRLDLPVALAAYNAGEGTVQRYGGLPPYPETQTYVRNILRRLGRTAGN
jgi:soluble lytic murein transglycosylase-like protein